MHEQSCDTCTWLQQTKHKYVKKRRREPSETVRCKILVYSRVFPKTTASHACTILFLPSIYPLAHTYRRRYLLPNRPKDTTGACIDCSLKVPERRGSMVFLKAYVSKCFPTFLQISPKLSKRQNWSQYLTHNANVNYSYRSIFRSMVLLLEELREFPYDIIPEIRARRIEQLAPAPTTAGLESLVKSERTHTRDRRHFLDLASRESKPNGYLLDVANHTQTQQYIEGDIPPAAESEPRSIGERHSARVRVRAYVRVYARARGWFRCKPKALTSRSFGRACSTPGWNSSSTTTSRTAKDHEDEDEDDDNNVGRASSPRLKAARDLSRERRGRRSARRLPPA